jgi:hypothetical protein
MQLRLGDETLQELLRARLGRICDEFNGCTEIISRRLVS